MMQSIKHKIRELFPKTPICLQQMVSRATPLVVFFHGIGQEHSYINNLYSSQTATGFEKIIDQLLGRFKPLEDLSADGIMNAGSGDLIVTFDDGLRSAYEIAAPILERKGLPAIFFINPDFMLGKSCFYRFEASLLCERLKEASLQQVSEAAALLGIKEGSVRDLSAAVKAVSFLNRGIYSQLAALLDFDMEAFFAQAKPYFTSVEAHDLLNRGFFLGSHSCDHPRYADIPPAEQVRQTLQSTRCIQETFDLPYRYFAFPFSDEDVTEDFYRQTQDGVDLYFTTGGWRRPDAEQGIYHRVWLDTVTDAIGEVKAQWDPL